MKTIVKKTVSLLLIMSMSIILISCGSTTEAPEGTTQATDTLKVEENLLSVELTIPASLVGDDAATLDEEAKAAGVSEITQNEDGSVTMKMSKIAHQKMLDEFKGSIDESLTEILNFN